MYFLFCLLLKTCHLVLCLGLLYRVLFARHTSGHRNEGFIQIGECVKNLGYHAVCVHISWMHQSLHIVRGCFVGFKFYIRNLNYRSSKSFLIRKKWLSTSSLFQCLVSVIDTCHIPCNNLHQCCTPAGP